LGRQTQKIMELVLKMIKYAIYDEELVREACKNHSKLLNAIGNL